MTTDVSSPEFLLNDLAEKEREERKARIEATRLFGESVKQRRADKTQCKELADGRNALAREFLVPPVSVINTHTAPYRSLERKWKETTMLSATDKRGWNYKGYTGESIFPMPLAEILLGWFGGKSIFDPYCGFVNKGIVARSLRQSYTGIDIQENQINLNRELCPSAKWICADSTTYTPEKKYDTLLACPPYYDLEVYSDLEGDISSLKTYDEFIKRMERGLVNQLPFINDYAVLIVGDIRDEEGFYRGFPDDIIQIFKRLGWGVHNRIVLYAMGSAFMRARKQFNSMEKVAKVHQEILVFRRRYGV